MFFNSLMFLYSKLRVHTSNAVAVFESPISQKVGYNAKRVCHCSRSTFLLANLHRVMCWQANKNQNANLSHGKYAAEPCRATNIQHPINIVCFHIVLQ